MKLQNRGKIAAFVIASMAAGAMSPSPRAAEKTAFELVKEGNQYVGKDVADKVNQIRSEKSQGSLVPSVWYIVYYDADASAKATEVKFASGQKVSVKRPFRLFQRIGRSYGPMPNDKMKIDSDKVLEIVQGLEDVQDVTLKASEMDLDKIPESDAPAWRVKLWAARKKDPSKLVGIGEVLISAFDGKVVEEKLRPDKVN